MLSRRVVVLMEDEEHARLKRLAERRGESMGALVREALREILDRTPLETPDASEAAAFLCQEHDPGFDWPQVKRDLVERHGA